MCYIVTKAWYLKKNILKTFSALGFGAAGVAKGSVAAGVQSAVYAGSGKDFV